MNEQEHPEQDVSVLRKEAQAWLVRLKSGDATTEDAEAFRAWCARSPRHQDALAQARRLWALLEPAMADVEHSDGSVQGRANVPAKPARGQSMGRRAFIGLAAAAVGYIAVSSAWDGLNGQGDFHTEVGEQKSLALNDGVQLEMNTRTRVNQRLSSDGALALEVLGGEVGVQMAQTGAPLTVFVGKGTITSKAARFNVRHWDGETCVTCIEGRLSVETVHGLRQLSAKQQLLYDEQGVVSVTAADIEKVTGWQNRMLIFDDESLAQMITEINRYREGRIILLNEQLARRRVQARIGLDQLDSVIALIRDSYGAHSTFLPGGVVILS